MRAVTGRAEEKGGVKCNSIQRSLIGYYQCNNWLGQKSSRDVKTISRKVRE